MVYCVKCFDRCKIHSMESERGKVEFVFLSQTPIRCLLLSFLWAELWMDCSTRVAFHLAAV